MASLSADPARQPWRTAGLVVVLVVVAKGLAFLREAFVAFELGTSASSDVYYLAFVLPTVLYNLGALPFSLWVTARLASQRAGRGSPGTAFYGRSVLIVLIIGVVCLATVVFAAARLVALYAPGLGADRMTPAVAATRIGALAIPALGLQAVSNGKLFAHGRFAIAYGWLAVSGLIGLGVVVTCTPVYGSAGAVLGFVVASWIAAFGGLWSTRWSSGAGQPQNGMLSEDFGVGIVYRAVVMQLFFQGSLLLVYVFGSGLAPGHLAASLFANKVQTALYETLVVTGGVLVYPRIARLLQAQDHRAVWDAVVRALGWLLPVGGTVVVVLVVCSSQIVSLLYKRHAFDEQSVTLVSDALLGLSPGILGLTMVEILHRAMVLRGRLLGYGIVFGVALGVNWLACRLLVPTFDVLGLTLGASIGVVGAAAGLLVYAVARLQAVNSRQVLVLAARTLGATAFGALVLLLIRAHIPVPHGLLGELLYVGVFVVAAVVLLWVGLTVTGYRWPTLIASSAPGVDRS